MKKFFNKFKNNKGNSLAEFAVTAAMMATLATTAAPAFSGVADAAKEKQTFANMDRIAGMINQYYSNKSASVGTSDLAEGRGRIPGQQNFEVQLGGYSTLDEVISLPLMVVKLLTINGIVVKVLNGYRYLALQRLILITLVEFRTTQQVMMV